jgi:UPF0755 protein
MKKNVRIIIISIFVPVLFIGLLFCMFLYKTSPISSQKKQRIEQIEIPSGMKVRTLADMLEEKQLIRSGRIFYIMARYPLLGKIAGFRTMKLESGIYQIKSSMSTTEIFNLVSSGRQNYVRVSFPEGLTVLKTAQRLEAAGVCSAADFISAAGNNELITKYNISGKTLEGYLFPDTYFFTPGIDAYKVADIMVNNFFRHIQNISVLKTLPRNDLKQTVILASIIEREYRIVSEAPLIASVFRNRMEKHIGLYSCATIEYILTEIEGKPHPDVITYEDLKIDSPYNTYKWADLPPGPISNPGMVALLAAAKPAQTNYYYFRLIDQDTGRHVFTADFDEHIKEGTLYHTKK